MIHWQTYYQQNKHLPLNTIMEGYKKLTLEFAERMVLITQQSQNVGSGYYSSSTPVVVSSTQKAIFGYGYNGTTQVSMTNLVSNTGVVATDTTGVGTARNQLAASGYGTDKAIFGYGATAVTAVSITNLVSNTGVVANNTTGVGTVRYGLAAAGYGTDKAIFGYGSGASDFNLTNLVSNTGVVATDTTGVGTARYFLAAAGYGTDKAIFSFGTNAASGYGYLNIQNLVSNTGVVATDTSGLSTRKLGTSGAGYGTDKAIMAFCQDYLGRIFNTQNLISNTGVIAADTIGVGTGRVYGAAAGYGADKAIFGFGSEDGGVRTKITNLVSNTGVVASNQTALTGTGRSELAAAGYSLT
jgi:hypothetical protein